MKIPYQSVVNQELQQIQVLKKDLHKTPIISIFQKKQHNYTLIFFKILHDNIIIYK